MRRHITDFPIGKEGNHAVYRLSKTGLGTLEAVDAIIQRDDGVTPTPVISWAILVRNRGRREHLADGIVPANGGTVTSELHDAFAIRYRVL